MKKSAVSLRTMKFEEVRFRFEQLRNDLFPDRFIIAVQNNQNSRQSYSPQMIYVNQRIGQEYSFPVISYSNRKGH